MTTDGSVRHAIKTQWDWKLPFGRGERFYYRTLPREEFDDTLAQVKRWGLDQYLKDRS